MTARSVFVTGTDTDAGKTHATVTLLHALRGRGLRAVGMKPVASGCEATPDGWRNADALALQAASDPQPAYDDCNPVALPLATAPQLAARAAGVTVTLGPLLEAHARLGDAADIVVVEGVGGWYAPLADGLDQGALIAAIGAPVLLVVGVRLGCLSHARLTLRAIEADGARCVGWIANLVDAAFADREAYVDLLRAALPGPCLGVLPHGPATPGQLDPTPLLD